jgi:hypothetical protein
VRAERDEPQGGVRRDPRRRVRRARRCQRAEGVARTQLGDRLPGAAHAAAAGRDEHELLVQRPVEQHAAAGGDGGLLRGGGDRGELAQAQRLQVRQRRQPEDVHDLLA